MSINWDDMTHEEKLDELHSADNAHTMQLSRIEGLLKTINEKVITVDRILNLLERGR